MFRRITVAAIAFCLAACTELPPPPEVGAGGAGGSAGLDGGAGTGGAGGGGSCSGVMLERTQNLEADDGVVCNAERVYVASGNLSAASDDSDRWSMNTDGGGHDILLEWEEMGQGFDLDLVLLDSDGSRIGTGTPQENPEHTELLTVDLAAGEQFFVEAQAVDTSGVNSLNYNLTVVPAD